MSERTRQLYLPATRCLPSQLFKSSVHLPPPLDLYQKASKKKSIGHCELSFLSYTNEQTPLPEFPLSQIGWRGTSRNNGIANERFKDDAIYRGTFFPHSPPSFPSVSNEQNYDVHAYLECQLESRRVHWTNIDKRIVTLFSFGVILIYALISITYTKLMTMCRIFKKKINKLST